MSRSTFVLVLVIGAVATLVAQAPPAAQLVATGPKPLWTVNTGLAAPESAYYHPQSNSIFVSNNQRRGSREGRQRLSLPERSTYRLR
jgi:hypothetical protein